MIREGDSGQFAAYGALPMLLELLWKSILLGSALAVVSVGMGWKIGEVRLLSPVRLVRWWLTRIVLPRLRSRSWFHRTITIALNNLAILAGLLVAGGWRFAPIAGIAAVGVTMGIALRVLAELPEGMGIPSPPRESWAERRVRVGMVLNLLEPPAIALTIGLSLGQSADGLPWGDAWEVFAVWVIPATLLAAGGEGLWIGESLRATDSPNHHDPNPADRNNER